MTHSVEQKLFIDLFDEALAFVGYKGRTIDIIFDIFECQMFPSDKKSKSFYHPVRPDYTDHRLIVHKEWIEAVVSDRLPTVIRTFAYYYAYGFYSYGVGGRDCGLCPHDSEAMAFSYGLMQLNGIPIQPLVPQEQVMELLSRFTHKEYKIIEGVSADGHSGVILTLSDDENSRLLSQLDEFDRAARNRKLNIRFGSKEHPFENINEAIKYIEYLECDAVENDDFLNSAYNKDIYRYDIGDCIYKGRHMVVGQYKIPWASAYTAHADNTFPVNSFLVTQLTPANDDHEWLQGERQAENFTPLFAMKPNLSRRRFLFRGQYEEFVDQVTGLPVCKPNLYRPNVDKNPLPHRIKAYEMACLVTRHPLVNLLGIKGVTIFNEPFRFQFNRLGLAQHYYNKTAFLDLTSDIEVAGFFATSRYDEDSDTYKPYSPDDKLGVLYIYDMLLPYEFKNKKLPQLSSIGKQYVFLRSAMQSGFLLNMPKGVDFHDLPNVYRVYFRHDKSISDAVAETTCFGAKYFPKDALSDYWRTMYKAPTSDYTISIKAREMYMRLHGDDYRSIDELDKALIAEGFRLGVNQWPEFPGAILDDYYDNARELWAEFCHDIFFLGAEGFFMKKSLEGLIDNKEYKQAFFR